MAGQNIGAAEDNKAEGEFRGIGEQHIAVLIRQFNAGSGRLGIHPDRYDPLLSAAEGLGHASGSGAYEDAPGNGRAGVIIQNRGIPLGGVGDHSIAPGNLQRAVGVDSVAGGGDAQGSAGDDDASSEDELDQP